MIKITPINFFVKIQNSIFTKNDDKKSQNAQFSSSNKQNCDYFNAIKNYNLAFLGKTSKSAKTSNLDKIVYIIDGYENYVKLTAREAGEKLNLEPKKILKCANGNSEEVGGFIAAYPENVEIAAKLGNHDIDHFMLKVVKESLNSLRTKLPSLEDIDFSDNNDADGIKIKKSKAESKTRKNNPQENNSQEITTKVPPDDNPDKKKQGHIYTKIESVKKLNDIPKEDLSKTLPRYLQSPFYIMNRDFECEKFYLRNHVARHLNVGKDTVALCVKGKTNLCQGYAMAEAKEIELLNESGKVVGLDVNFLKEKFPKEEKEDYFYAVDEKGECKKLETIEEASKELGVTPLSIATYFLSKQKNATIANHVLVKKDEIETKRKDGTMDFDIKKIRRIRNLLAKGAVYIVDPETKKKTRYDSKQEAADALGVSYQLITNAALGYNKTAKGFIVINANEIEEYTKSGEILINEKKIDELISNLNVKEEFDVAQEGFYAIKENYAKQFFSYKEAQKETGANAISISNILKGKGISANGYVFARSSEIDIKKEDGTTEPDKAKIIRKLKILDEKALYAIGADFIKRFDDQKTASAELEINISQISACINKKHATSHNMAFVPALEVEKRDKDGNIIILEDVVEKIRQEKKLKTA